MHIENRQDVESLVYHICIFHKAKTEKIKNEQNLYRMTVWQSLMGKLPKTRTWHLFLSYKMFYRTNIGYRTYMDMVTE